MKDKKFTVCLTHDVDRVKKSYQHLTHFARTRNIHHLTSLIRSENPYWTFDKIMDLEEKYKVRSTFFFLNEEKKFTLKPKEFELYYGRYDVQSPDVSEIIKKLDSGGWEIGLHGSYNSYLDRDLLSKEKKLLESIVGHKILGVRQHFLNLKIPATWKLQNSIGLRYDSSFGFINKIGFKDKIYQPFKPFDTEFFVIPSVIMDCALFMQSDNLSDAWKKCLRIIDEAETETAVLTVIWHSESFSEIDFLGWAEIYEKFIIECKQRGALFTNCVGLIGGLNGKY